MKCGQGTRERKLHRLPLCGFAAVVLLSTLLCSCGGGASGLEVILNPSSNQSVDQAESVSFTAFVPGDTSNSGVTWSISGAPHCLGAACGTLVNKTTTAVTYQAPQSVPQNELLTITLTATANAEKSATATLKIVVSPAPVISTTTLPGVLNGATYNQQIIANGGVAPLIFTVSSGSLPPGLNLNTNGFITGRTTSDGGTYDFTVLVTDQGSPPLTASKPFSLVVTPAPTLSIASTSLINAAQGSPYNAALGANGGVPPLTWSITSGSLPPGLTLAASTGQISGTPTTQGTFSFTVKVVDSSLLPPNNQPQTATQSLSITVGPPSTLAIATTSLPQAESANLYSQKIVVTGGVAPFNWTLTKGILPTGMSLNASTGVISGVATAVSSNTFTIQVTDSENPPATASATFTISIIASTTGNNNALLEGDYVFIFSGYNPNGPVVLGGNLEADGSGNIAGIIDSNNDDAANTTQNNGPGPTLGNALTGTYAMKPNGTGTLTVTVNSIVYTYLVALDGNGNAQLIEADSTSTGTRGTGILRTQPPPNFVASNFTGNYAFELAGIDASGRRATFAGVFHADGVGNFNNATVDSDDAGTVGTNVTGVSGTFLVAQNGRGNASFSIPGASSLSFVFYMITPSDVLFMGFDPLDSSHPMMTGEAILQTQPSFDATSMDGPSIVTETGQDTSKKSSVLLAQLTGNGAGAITCATNTNDGGSTGSTTASGSYAVSSDGRVAMSGLGNQLSVLYLISPNYGFVIGQNPSASSGLVEAQSAGPFNAASFTSYFSFGPPLTGPPGAGSSGTNDFVGSIISDGASAISGTIGETTGSDVLNLNLSTKGSYTVNSNGSGSISFGSPTQLPSQFVFYLVSPTEIRAISAVPSDTQPMVFFLNH